MGDDGAQMSDITCRSPFRSPSLALLCHASPRFLLKSNKAEAQTSLSKDSLSLALSPRTRRLVNQVKPNSFLCLVNCPFKPKEIRE